MGFFMDGLEAEAYDRTYKDSALVRRVIGYFKPQAGRMAIVALVIALNSLTSLALLIYISRSLDRLQADPQGTNLFGITLILVGLASLGWVFNAVRGWFSAQAVGNVVLQLREDAFDAVLRRDLSFYDQFPSGKIVSRVTSDTQAFSQVVTLTMDLLSRILVVFLLVAYGRAGPERSTVCRVSAPLGQLWHASSRPSAPSSRACSRMGARWLVPISCVAESFCRLSCQR